MGNQLGGWAVPFIGKFLLVTFLAFVLIWAIVKANEARRRRQYSTILFMVIGPIIGLIVALVSYAACLVAPFEWIGGFPWPDTAWGLTYVWWWLRVALVLLFVGLVLAGAAYTVIATYIPQRHYQIASLFGWAFYGWFIGAVLCVALG